MSDVEVRDHWGDTAHLWRPGVPVITWHLTFEHHPELHGVAARLAPPLEVGWLDIVPRPWLHLTLQGVGLEPDVSGGVLRRIAEQAAALCSELAPLDISLGPAALAPHGVALGAGQPRPLVELRDRLQDADAAVRGQAAVPDWREPFDPHVTLAYANRSAQAGDLPARLAAATATAALAIRQVSLLRLHRGERLYYWDVLATVPLGPVTP